MNVLLRMGLEALSVQLPSSVAGMMLVFTGLLLCHGAMPAFTHRVVDVFRPSSGFLQRWLGLFFVPPLVMLPMETLPAGIEAGKMLLLLVVGAIFTLVTSAWALQVLLRRRASLPVVRPPVSVKPKYLTYLVFWSSVAAVSGVISWFVDAAILHALFLLAVTVGAFVLAIVLQERLKRSGIRSSVRRLLVTTVHPVILSAVVAAIVLFSLPFSPEEYLTGGTWYPGAGAVLLGLLDPAFISLGFLLFLKREILARYAVPLLVCIVAAALLSLFVTAIAARVMAMEQAFALATLSRSVTTPVALPMADVLGASPGLTAAFVVLTGVFGAVAGPSILRMCGFRSPLEWGMAMGASAHGIGTAALIMDKMPTAAAVSAVTFVLVAATSAIAVSIEPVHAALWYLVGYAPV